MKRINVLISKMINLPMVDMLVAAMGYGAPHAKNIIAIWDITIMYIREDVLEIIVLILQKK